MTLTAPRPRYGWPSARSGLIPVGSEVECLRQGKVACFGVVVEHCTSAEFLNRPGALGRMGYVVQTEAWTVLGLARDKSWWAPDSVRPV